MCNLYTQTSAPEAIRMLFERLELPLAFPEGVPNLEPRDIAITDLAPIVRAGGNGRYELVVRRWSWPGPGGKPVYNFRSEGREFPAGRALILADGFYEFTRPADPRQKRKDRWLFANPDQGVLGIAGLVRESAGIGEAFTMLTTIPGSDVTPFHGRQVALLQQTDWRSWLDHEASAAELIHPAPAGSLAVRPAPRAESRQE